MLMVWRSQPLCGECMNRGGHMRKKLEHVRSYFLPLFFPRIGPIERGAFGPCGPRSDGADGEGHVPIEQHNRFFADRFAHEVWEIEKTAQNGQPDLISLIA